MGGPAGTGYFLSGADQEVPFCAGQVLVSEKGQCHGAKNTGEEDIIFVSIVTPVPADYQPIGE